MEIRLKSYHKIYTTLPQIHLPARCFHWLICSWSIQQTPPRELVLAYHHQPHCTPILFLRGGRFYDKLCKKNYRLVLIKKEFPQFSFIAPSSQGTQIFPRPHDCDKCNSAQNSPSFSLHFHVDFLRRLHGAFAQCWRARQRNVFLEKIVFLRFSRSQKAFKRQRAMFGLSFALVNIMKMIFVIKLRLHEGRRSPAIIWLIWLCLWLSTITD